MAALTVGDAKQKNSKWCESSDFKDVFGSVVNDQTAFFAMHWEKTPCKFSWNGTGKATMENIMTRDGLLRIVSDNEIFPDTNLDAMKYTADGRVPLHFENEALTKEDINTAFEDKYTVQFFQPQRFSDGMHVICAGFEHVFGTLAGASAYLTPPHAQGLAPHHDDVEVFIFHTEGTKRWRLWSPLSTLPEHPSSDIPRDQLPGNPVEVILSPGDVLYLPRGVIHEAIADDSFCTHVTVSVYQRHSMKTLLLRTIPHLLEKAFDEEESYRRGLPLHINQELGTYPQWAADCGGDKALLSRRTSLSSTVHTLLSSLPKYLTMEALDAAADEMDNDFRMHRIPPPVTPANAISVDISADDILLCDSSSYHAAVHQEDGVMVLLLAGIRNNSRMNHMGHPSFDIDEDEQDDNELMDDENNAEDDEDEDNQEHNECCEDGGECHVGCGGGSDDGSDDSQDDEGWETMLPMRSARLLYALQHAYSTGGVTAKQLTKTLPDFELDEVLDTVQMLSMYGIVEVGPTKAAKKKRSASEAEEGSKKKKKK